MTDHNFQESIDAKNSEFWNTLCGTSLASALGINDFSAESLEKFDRYYMELYPYLKKYIPFEQMNDKKVLEVGLGYGTVAQKIGLAGAHYTGLDIAAGPVEVVNLRYGMHGLKGHAQQGSILKAPFESERFDYVVSIGCLHHTGNVAGGLDEIYRILKPGGTAIIMIYNAYSYRRWYNWFVPTLKYLIRDYFHIGAASSSSDSERKAYDSAGGDAAPETVFTSVHRLRKMARKFKTFSSNKENADQEKPFLRYHRSTLLKTVAPCCGLDIYATLTK